MSPRFVRRPAIRWRGTEGQKHESRPWRGGFVSGVEGLLPRCENQSIPRHHRVCQLKTRVFRTAKPCPAKAPPDRPTLHRGERALTAHALRRTGAPIRRHSRAVGRCEGGFWRPFRAGDAGRYMLAAERFDRSGRERGRRNGPLGPVGLEVLRELLRLIDYRTGRLEPSLQTLMTRLRRSRDAIVRGLASLRAAGFLDWLRRWEPTGAKEGEGPTVKQASNAYRLALPPAAARLVPTLAPVPADEAQRAIDRAADRAAMIDALPLWEQGSAMTTSPLGAVLDRLGAAVARCESAGRTESPNREFKYGVGLRPDPVFSRRGR